MLENTFCKLIIGINLKSYWWFNCEQVLVFYAANNISMIHRISIRKYRDAQINCLISIVQISALQAYMMSIFIKNKKGSLQKDNGIVNLILVVNILFIPSNHSYVNICQNSKFKLVIENPGKLIHLKKYF